MAGALRSDQSVLPTPLGGTVRFHLSDMRDIGAMLNGKVDSLEPARPDHRQGDRPAAERSRTFLEV
jgi:hypothetical protein